MTIKNILFCLILMICFNSCEKIIDEINKGKTDCEEMKKIRIKSTTKTSYYVGEDIIIDPAIKNMTNVMYSWYGPGFNTSTISSSGYGVSNCAKWNSGMYYLTCTSTDCPNPVRDSIYISVINKPVPVPCTTINDSIEFSSIPSTSYSVRRYQNTTWNKFCVEGSSKSGYYYPNFQILFHDNWTGKEPEDGVYITSAFQTLSNNPSNYYQVFISTLYSGIYMSSWNNDSVYVTHENNKLKISFCKINLSGTNGSTVFKATARGNLITP